MTHISQQNQAPQLHAVLCGLRFHQKVLRVPLPMHSVVAASQRKIRRLVHLVWATPACILGQSLMTMQGAEWR